MNQYYDIQKARIDSVQKLIVAKYGANSEVHAEPGKIRLELPILNGKGQYVFDPKNMPVDNVTTFGLNRNDVFVPSAIQFFIAIRNKETRVEELYTFAPINDGTTPSAFPVGFATKEINALYQGNVQWMIGSEALWSAYPMENFHKVPETQPCFLLNSSDAVVRQGMLERHMDQDLELLLQRIIMAGTRDHKITVNFDASELSFGLASDTETATDYEARLVLYMDGTLVKSGCQNGDLSPFGKAIGNW